MLKKSKDVQEDIHSVASLECGIPPVSAVWKGPVERLLFGTWENESTVGHVDEAVYWTTQNDNGMWDPSNL